MDPNGSAPSGSASTSSEVWWLDVGGQARMLGREWRAMVSGRTIVPDTLAGIAVALVALPLTLAIANASGVSSGVGLTTAIVAGIVVALFGGCRLQVSGPAAAMTFLVAEIIAKYGAGSLIVATLIAGLLQIVAGLGRLGRIMQFFPRPVIAGFLSGIGLTILCTQVAKVLGYTVPTNEEGGAVGLLVATVQSIDQTKWQSLVVGAIGVLLMVILPRISSKIPTPLVALTIASLVPLGLGWDSSVVTRLDGLPTGEALLRQLTPGLPEGVNWGQWNEIVLAGLAIFFLASLESLLSASVVSAMNRESRVDNDQELVGQGLGNLASALFGGIPVTGVIARSATNIQAGGRTRLSAVIHAFILLVMLVFFEPVVKEIPIPALAGILCAVAIRMVDVRLFQTLWNGSRPEAIVYLVTVVAILLTDLIVGVPVGLIAALLYVTYEMSRLNIQQFSMNDLNDQSPTSHEPAQQIESSVQILRVEGPLFFASGYHLINLLRKNDVPGESFVIDLHEVPMLDVTGAEILEEAAELIISRGGEFLLASPTSSVTDRLKTLREREFRTLQHCPIYETVEEAIAHTQHDLRGSKSEGSPGNQ